MKILFMIVYLIQWNSGCDKTWYVCCSCQLGSLK